MPRRLELDALQAELAGLGLLLDEAMDVSDPIGVLQYKQRRCEIEQEISSLLAGDRHASVAVYFGGKPVFGSRGIAADFAGRVLEHFQGIVSKEFAKSELGSLGERGRIPLKNLTTLMVTGITHGSFGFLLEELTEQTEMFDTELKEMLPDTLKVIGSAGSVDDREFEENAENLDPRTLSALKDFFSDLDSFEATVRFVDDQHDLFLDDSAIDRAKARIEATQIDEDDTLMTGSLEGFLPEHRRFELRSPSRGLIYGTATKESTEQFASRIRSGEKTLYEQCTVRLRERTVKSMNRPARQVYRLLEFTEFGQPS